MSSANNASKLRGLKQPIPGAQYYEPFWDGRTKDDNRRVPNLQLNSSSQLATVLIYDDSELLYNPLSPKTNCTLDHARTLLAKQKAATPKARHPVKDPAMTTRHFFHQS